MPDSLLDMRIKDFLATRDRQIAQMEEVLRKTKAEIQRSKKLMAELRRLGALLNQERPDR
ncbi:MAG TPA: hypothetical protein VKY65_21425 [Alphaproteobacteria bacterium]|nr:hypothetical protein [Alphaproteobacteria bacterium]